MTTAREWLTEGYDWLIWREKTRNALLAVIDECQTYWTDQVNPNADIEKLPGMYVDGIALGHENLAIAVLDAIDKALGVDSTLQARYSSSQEVDDEIQPRP